MYAAGKLTAAGIGLLAVTTIGWLSYADTSGEVTSTRGATHADYHEGAVVLYGNSTESAVPRVDKITVTWTQMEAARNIEAILQEKTTLEFPGVPLLEAITHIQDQHHIPIRLAEQILEDAGVAVDTAVDLVVNEISLESALNMLLENVNGVALTYLIRNEVVWVTTVEAADEFLETRVYDVGPLRVKHPAEIVDVIQNVTEGPWLDVDGLGGTISAISGQLVIRQTQTTHREIEALLNNLLHNLNESPYPVPDWSNRLEGFEGGGFSGGSPEPAPPATQPDAPASNAPANPNAAEANRPRFY